MSEKDFRISYAAARVNKGWTQKEAAEKLGISLSTLQNYENGETVPNWKNHNKMAEIYEVPSEMLKPQTY